MSVTQIGNYQVSGEIARGAMGVVFRGHDPALARDVAIKVLLTQSASENDLQRFQIEAQATARLRHSNIVAMQAAGVHQGKPFLVMDLIDGGSLKDLIKRQGKVGARRAAEITEKLARALDYAHGLGVLHRDIKPANVLIDTRGEPLLTDFGLAKVLGRDAKVTLSGEITGTPVYMAPEQALGIREQMGTPIDIYALGATLYEMLTGQPPFKGTTVIGVLADVQNVTPPAPTALVPLLDPALEAICVKAMEKDPADRFASAREMADQLAAFLRGELTVQPVQPQRAVGGGLVAGLAVGLAVGGAGAALATWGWLGARAKAEAQQTRVADLEERLGAARKASTAAEEALAEQRREPARKAEALADSARTADGVEAVELWLQATVLSPNDAGLWIGLGEARLVAKQPEAAKAAFDRVLELSSVSLPGWLGRAQAERLLGDLDAAAKDVAQALSLDGDNARAYAERGSIQLAQGAPGSAIASCDAALDKQPDLALALQVRARARMIDDDRDPLALEDVDRWIEIEAASAQAHLYRGMILWRLRRNDASANALARAITLAKDDRETLIRAHCESALVYQYSGQPEQADRTCQIAVQLGPGSPFPPAYMGMLLSLRGDQERALEWLNRALSLDRDCGPALWFRAQIHATRRDLDAAKADFVRAIETMQFGRYVVRLKLIELAQATDDWGMVEAQWSAILVRKPKHRTAYHYRGVAREHVGNLRGALEDQRHFLAASDRSDPKVAKRWGAAQQAITRLERQLR